MAEQPRGRRMMGDSLPQTVPVLGFVQGDQVCFATKTM
jgi:hypothetical protein